MEEKDPREVEKAITNISDFIERIFYSFVNKILIIENSYYLGTSAPTGIGAINGSSKFIGGINKKMQVVV